MLNVWLHIWQKILLQCASDLLLHYFFFVMFSFFSNPGKTQTTGVQRYVGSSDPCRTGQKVNKQTFPTTYQQVTHKVKQKAARSCRIQTLSSLLSCSRHKRSNRRKITFKPPILLACPPRSRQRSLSESTGRGTTTTCPITAM